jgi:hypothetical protein
VTNSVDFQYNPVEITRRLLSRIERAKRSAVATTTTWGRKELSKKLEAANPKIPRIVFSKFRTKRKVKGPRDNEYGVIWGGGRRVKAKYLAQRFGLRQEQGGARAGQFFFSGAFVVTFDNGHSSIFKRSGAGRLPLVEQYGSIDNLEQSISALVPAINAEVLRRFEAKLAVNR